MAKGKVITALLQLKDKNFGAGIRQGSSNLDKFRRGVYRASDGVNKFSKTTMSGFNRIGQASSSLTKTIIGLGTAIAGLKAVDLAKDQVLGGIDSASSLESYRLTLETVMKDTKKAGETMKWASQFANITPFETDQVIEGTVRLQSYGIEAQKTMGSIGDMAAVMNKDLMQAIEAVADAQTGELERMKEFGITKAMIEKKAGQMFKKQVVINNKGQIVDQKKFNQALFALMDERFKGGMEKQATTFKGLKSTITGTWKTGMAEMVGVTAEGTIRQGSLFEKLKKKADEVSKRFQQWANDGTFTRIGDKLSSMASKFEEKLPAIKTFFEDLKTPMQIVGDILKKIGDGFQSIVKFANEHPDIAKAIGLTAAGAAVAKKTGLLSLGKGIFDTVSKATGTQSIKAAVVNVYGTKVNGGTGSGLPDVAGGSGKSSKAGKVGKGLTTVGAFASRSALPAAAISSFVGGTFFAGSNFDKARQDPDSLYSSKILANNPVPKVELVSKEQLMLSANDVATISDKQVQELQNFMKEVKDAAAKPTSVNVTFSGVTVREEADIKKITQTIVSEIKKTYGMVTTSETTFGGYSMVRGY